MRMTDEGFFKMLDDALEEACNEPPVDPKPKKIYSDDD
jgi:hypothetical protein